jgi:uncharacterized protein YcfJ
MNKSMLIGVVGGIAVATAGGVAGYAFLSPPSGITEQGSAVVMEHAAPEVAAPQAAQPIALAAVAPAPAAAPAARPAAAAQTAPRPAAQTAPRPAAAPVQQAAIPAPIAEECWDEEVTVQVDPKDDKAIAGTAAGAVLGGALAKKLGDDNDLATAAGAAAGAFAGRRLQKRVQANNTTTTIERRCAPVGTR